MSDIKLACDVAEQVRTICDKHGNNPGELINILHEAQHLHGYLPEEMQRIIASKLEYPRIESIWSGHLLYLLHHDSRKGNIPSPSAWVRHVTCAAPRSYSKNSNAY